MSGAKDVDYSTSVSGGAGGFVDGGSDFRRPRYGCVWLSARQLLAFFGLLTCSPVWGMPEVALLEAKPEACERCYPVPTPPPPAGPRVTLQLLVPAGSEAGKDLEYRIIVRNSSDVAAHKVTVHDAIPDNTRFVKSDPPPTTTDGELIWQLGTLEPGGRRDIHLVLRPTGEGAVRNCVRVSLEHGLCVVTRIAGKPAAARISIHKRGPAQGWVGDKLRFQLIVVNGDRPARNVIVKDLLPEGLEHPDKHKTLTWEIGDLAAGESRSVDYEVVARAPGKLQNRAVVTADGGIRDEVAASVVVQESRLTLAVIGPKKYSASKAVPFQITVANEGTEPVANVTVVNPVPANGLLIAATQGAEIESGRVRWRVPRLAAGERRIFEVQIKGKQAGELVNHAEVWRDSSMRTSASARTELVGQAAILLEVVDTKDPIPVGSDTTYVITVRNQGAAAATGVKIVAEAPEGLGLVRVQGPVDHRRDGQVITYDPIAIPAEGTAVLRITLRGLKAGDFRFKVQMTCDQLPGGPLREVESTTVFDDRPPAAPE